MMLALITLVTNNYFKHMYSYIHYLYLNMKGAYMLTINYKTKAIQLYMLCIL